jgi:hypothetical protein
MNRPEAFNIAACGLLAVLLSACSASAETRTLLRSGIWEAFGGATSKGNPICGMSAEVNTRYFGIKRIAGDDMVTIQLGTPQWKLDRGEKKQVRLIFESNSPWNAPGTGMHFDDGDPGLEFTINQGEVANFMREFQMSGQLVVQFPDANFPDWKLSLSGSSAVRDAFSQCTRHL